jgi:hypothetical protein
VVPGFRAGVNAYRAGYPDASSRWRMDPVESDADESVVGEVEAGLSQWANGAPKRFVVGAR